MQVVSSLFTPEDSEDAEHLRATFARGSSGHRELVDILFAHLGDSFEAVFHRFESALGTHAAAGLVADMQLLHGGASERPDDLQQSVAANLREVDIVSDHLCLPGGCGEEVVPK